MARAYTGAMNTAADTTGTTMNKPLAIQNYIYAQYRKCAIKRGFAFNLTIEEFLAMASAPCVYCRKVNSNRAYRAQYAVKEWFYNGVDRINSKLDYAMGNTVSCCGECNAAKSDMDAAAFIASEWLAQRNA